MEGLLVCNVLQGFVAHSTDFAETPLTIAASTVRLHLDFARTTDQMVHAEGQIRPCSASTTPAVLPMVSVARLKSSAVMAAIPDIDSAAHMSLRASAEGQFLCCVPRDSAAPAIASVATPPKLVEQVVSLILGSVLGPLRLRLQSLRLQVRKNGVRIQAMLI